MGSVVLTVLDVVFECVAAAFGKRVLQAVALSLIRGSVVVETLAVVAAFEIASVGAAAKKKKQVAFCDYSMTAVVAFEMNDSDALEGARVVLQDSLTGDADLAADASVEVVGAAAQVRDLCSFVFVVVDASEEMIPVVDVVAALGLIIDAAAVVVAGQHAPRHHPFSLHLHCRRP